MRKLFTIIVFTIIVLIIGRNLTFLPRITQFFNPKTETLSLKQEVKKIIQGQKGNYSVYFADFNDNNLYFGINENEVYKAASINKLPIVAVLYYLAKKGEFDLNEKVTIQNSDIQDYGTGIIRYQKPGTVYSLKTLAKLSLQHSDNTAAHVLGKKIGTQNLQKTIEELGLKQTHMANNQSSLSDMQILFKKIYKGEITDPSLTKELLSFLKDTDIEDRLPKLLPSDAIVYHKTGDAIGNIHDVGIIEIDDFVFFIGVATSDIGDWEKDTAATIAKIAKKIFDFRTSKK